MTRMKRTRLSSSYMFGVKRASLVLEVNVPKPLLDSVYIAVNFFSNLSLSDDITI